MTADKVFVYCGDPSHPRRVAVTNFVAMPGGGWHEEPASHAPITDVGTGYHLIGDTPAWTGWALDPEVSNADLRDKFDLSCRKCAGRGRGVITVHRETLFYVLDGCRASGMSELPLTLIAASLGRSRSAAEPQTPEPGQG